MFSAARAFGNEQSRLGSAAGSRTVEEHHELRLELDNIKGTQNFRNTGETRPYRSTRSSPIYMLVVVR